MQNDKKISGMEHTENNDLPELNSIGEDILPPNGLFDKTEAVLFERINLFEKENVADQNTTGWESVLATDETAQPEIADAAGKKLFDRILQLSDAETVERYKQKDALVFFPFLFMSVPLSFAKNRIVQAASIVVLIALTGIIGWNHIYNQNTPVQTIALLYDNGASGATRSIVSETQTVHTASGQRMILSNERGTVIVENGASLTVRKSTRNRMDYVVAFSDYSKNPDAKVLFTVTKKKNGQQFFVSTTDYAITVVGTIFRIIPQQQGHVSTEIIEGIVSISGSNVPAMFVSGGNIFSFNSALPAYAVSKISTEPVPPAEQVDTLESAFPEPQQKQTRHVVKINTGHAAHDSLLDCAVRLESSDWQKAIDMFGAVLKRQGSSAYSREIALFSIGRLLAGRDTSSAVVRAAFNAYLKEFPNGSFTGESYLRLADMEYKVNPDQALAWYEKYVQEFPSTQNTAAAEYKAGLIYLEQHNHEKAVVMLSNALSHAKNYPQNQIAAIQRGLDNAKNAR